MTADFFENQARALRKTGLLTFLFFAATFLIICGVYAAIMAFVLIQFGYDPERSLFSQMFQPKLFAVVAGGTLMVVLGGTIFKIFELRQGGSVVAELLGGTPVPPDPRDPDERKLLNVVEEMSIASGCPMPAVYLLREEASINAFAAGFSPTDAAIGVTRGAIRNLSRDELQGVVAHEFSHIVNGDMRLNIKLMGTIHGILQLGILGGALIRIGFYSGEGRRSRSRNDKNGGAFPLIALGLILFVLGYIGVFFGKLIKAAVSRQREFLADAAAVQYTRYPEGIAGALIKIGGLDLHGRIENRHAEEASHFFFGDAMEGTLLNFGGMLSTHPPLPVRIRAIMPTFDGDFPSINPPPKPEARLEPEKVSGAPTGVGLTDKPRVEPLPPPVRGPFAAAGMVLPPDRAGAAGPSPNVPIFPVTAAAAIEAVGKIDQGKLDFARRLLEALPDGLRARVRRPGGAQGVVLAILLGECDEAAMQKAWRLIPAELQFETRGAMEELQQSDPRARLPLVDLALPSLKQIPENEELAFLKLAQNLITVDRQTTLLEYTIGLILEKHLDPEKRLHGRKAPRHHSLSSVLQPLQVMLSALSHTGTRDIDKAHASFAAAVKALGPEGAGLKLLGPEVCGLDPIRKAFVELHDSAPAVKKKIITAAAGAVVVDGHVTIGEADLLRAVAESLDVPMPPLLTK